MSEYSIIASTSTMLRPVLTCAIAASIRRNRAPSSVIAGVTSGVGDSVTCATSASSPIVTAVEDSPHDSTAAAPATRPISHPGTLSVVALSLIPVGLETPLATS